MREYHEVFGHELPPLPRELVLSDYYTPSNEQHRKELGFIALSMIGIGGVLYYFEHCIDESISSNRRSYQITSMYKKMASAVMLIGGALANALPFTGSSYLFHRLSKDSIDAERARHDVAIEKLRAAQIKWAHK